MPNLSWIEQVEELSPAALTVRAQTISPDDNGQLLWPIFMPRADVDSIHLRDAIASNRRPAADRREWNGRGRLIPVSTPALREMTMVPIEAYDQIEEYEMQMLRERTLGGNADQVRNLLQVSIPQRVDGLVEADFRRLELDVFGAWANGTIVQRDPQTGRSFTASYGIDSSRYATASTAWDTADFDAYGAFLAWYESAIERSGQGRGALLRLAVIREIQRAAPTLMGGVAMTRAQLADRISQDLGQPFQFFIVENTVDVFTDGGTATTTTKVWPQAKVAFVPANGQVGVTAFAPVARAMDIADEVPEAGVDIRGATVFYKGDNMGRELTMEAQLNAFPVPDANRVEVIDTGVTP